MSLPNQWLYDMPTVDLECMVRQLQFRLEHNLVLSVSQGEFLRALVWLGEGELERRRVAECEAEGLDLELLELTEGDAA